MTVRRGYNRDPAVSAVAEELMASEFSFDIVSKPDMQEVKNALQQLEKVIASRYDFKGSISEVKFDDEKFTLHSDDEFHLTALTDVLHSSLVKRGIDLRFLDPGKIEEAAKATVRQEITLKAGLPTDKAKQITKLIKESSGRVQEGAKLSQETEEALKKIVSGVEATAGKIGEIATATVQQASNSEEVSKAIQGISQVTEQAAAGSEEMASSSEQLGAQAQALRDLVGQFRVGANGASAERLAVIVR